MSRSRVIYACQGVFVGPAPATGYNFINYLGQVNNTSSNIEDSGVLYQPSLPVDFMIQPFVSGDANNNNLKRNHNLLHKLDRVIGVSYELSTERINIKQLGKRSLVARPLINQPSLSLTVDYLLNGVKNELRAGFNANYAQFQYPYSGQPFYSSKVFPFSGMLSSVAGRTTGEPFVPTGFTDSRNIYLVVCDEGQDLKGVDTSFDTLDLEQGLDPRVTGFHVLAFGDCYIESYKTAVAVNSLPKASITWASDNVQFYTSGSGINIPAINPKTRELISGIGVIIPKLETEDGPSVIVPGDISLDITGLNNIGLSNDLKIQGYSIDVNFNREALSSLGYKNYICRKINFPLIINFSVDVLVGDSAGGSIINLLQQDTNYDISIKLKNPDSCSTGNSNPRHSGPYLTPKATAIQYDFLGAKYISSSFSSSIGENKMARMMFSVEADPDNLAHGWFISGLLNIAKIEDYLLDGDGSYLLWEDNSPIVTNLIPLY